MNNDNSIKFTIMNIIQHEINKFVEDNFTSDINLPTFWIVPMTMSRSEIRMFVLFCEYEKERRCVEISLTDNIDIIITDLYNQFKN